MPTALLTGALGGLGCAIARRLAADGIDLVLTDLASCDEMVSEIAETGPRVWQRPCDLGDEADVRRLLEWIDGLGQPVDILINNGAELGLASLESMTLEHLRKALRTNVEAPYLLCQALGTKMASRGWGRIVNVVSASAWCPPIGFMSYITSKMGLVGLTRTFAMELGNQGVTVNAISPALTLHRNTANALPQTVWDAQLERLAIKRIPVPEDFVGTISFLVSEDSAFVTAQTIFANGGGMML